ncbi:MAG: hypothetical protein KGO93_09030 [Cyanobacteria bacterium REEB446]|nr:hypothetical protein [Cyanobacteria bacterium REEB446]
MKGINSPGCGNGLYTTSQMILNSQSLNSHLIIYSDQKYALVNSKEYTVKPLRNRLWEGTIAILRIGNDIDNSYEQAFNKKMVVYTHLSIYLMEKMIIDQLILR